MQLEVAVQRHSGVVHHDVDAPEVGGDGGGVLPHRGAVADIELVGPGPVAGGAADQVRGLLQAGHVDIGDREAGAMAGGQDGECTTDAGPGAGDDHDLVAQRLHAPTSTVSWRAGAARLRGPAVSTS